VPSVTSRLEALRTDRLTWLSRALHLGPPALAAVRAHTEVINLR
jgi:hypothetical protein